MSEERSLDEALDELEKWGEEVVHAVEPLTPEQVIEHFRQAQARLEQQIGKRLDLPVRSTAGLDAPK